jgi:nitrogen fixation protein NifU and related proteins
VDLLTPPLKGLDERFVTHIVSPRNQGQLNNPNGLARGVGVCGDWIDVQLRVVDNQVTEIKCLPHGCVYTLACASAMSELAKGLDLDGALDMDEVEVADFLGGLPDDHRHCARLAVHALGQAIDDYYQRARNQLART